ncbi:MULTISPECIES: hypothetical protein [unclassified Methanobrevibacter]
MVNPDPSKAMFPPVKVNFDNIFLFIFFKACFRYSFKEFLDCCIMWDGF